MLFFLLGLDKRLHIQGGYDELEVYVELSVKKIPLFFE